MARLPPPPPPYRPEQRTLPGMGPSQSSMAPGRRWSPGGVLLVMAGIPACIGGTVLALKPVLDAWRPPMGDYVLRADLEKALKARDAEWSRASQDCTAAVAKSNSTELALRETQTQCRVLDTLFKSLESRK